MNQSFRLYGKFSLAEQVPSDSAVPLIRLWCVHPSLMRGGQLFDDFKAGKSWEELAASTLRPKAAAAKTGILNLQHTNNFQTCLVAYALRAIERCGSKAQVINYRPRKARRSAGLFGRRGCRAKL
ncbi:MAG: hypothetical protein ACLSE6_01470 [Alphaproteobacteria bacterium]